jgi:hypothetical protein
VKSREEGHVEISQPNNAVGPPAGDKRFGIRVSALPSDPFARLVGPDWHAFHWFATREERDQVMQDMGARHRYSRIGDVPTIVLEPIER